MKHTIYNGKTGVPFDGSTVDYFMTEILKAEEIKEIYTSDLGVYFLHDYNVTVTGKFEEREKGSAMIVEAFGNKSDLEKIVELFKERQKLFPDSEAKILEIAGG